MSTKEELHKKQILNPFVEGFIKKYDKGVAEHGGGLYRKPLTKILDWGYEEILDFVCYYSTVQQHIKEIEKMADEGLNEVVDPIMACTAILNIIRTGSPDGSQAEGD